MNAATRDALVMLLRDEHLTYVKLEETSERSRVSGDGNGPVVSTMREYEAWQRAAGALRSLSRGSLWVCAAPEAMPGEGERRRAV